jgi:adenylate cyclase class 2
LGSKILSARHFEDNSILDFPDKRLQLNQCLIRIRSANGQTILTYKGPPRPDGIFKVREELETSLGDGESSLQILERLGMRIGFRYQKYRREFSIGEVIVALDETPIGCYAEFEGTEPAIMDLAQKMGIDSSQFLRASYYSLYVEYCEKNGRKLEHMTF